MKLGLGLLGVLAAGVGGLIAPSASAVRSADRAIAAAASELGQLPERPAQLERQSQALAKAVAFEKEHIKPIPQQGDIAGLVRGLSVYLDRLGVRSREIATGAPTRSGGLVSLPISLTMRGDFASAYAVLEHVDALPRLIRARRLRIAWEKPGEARGAERQAAAALEANLLKVEILLEVIVASEPEPAESKDGAEPHGGKK